MSHTDITLTPQDAYVLARAIVGLLYDGVPLSPLTGLLLAHLDPQMPDDLQILRRVLGQQLMLEVLRVDPDAAPPEAPFRNTDLNIVPDLPEDARLTEAQIKEASSVGTWLDDYVRWAGTAANETPLNFHIGAGLYLAAIAVGRRLYIQTPWRQQVFSNLDIMIVAVSTYYRKSVGLSLANEVARPTHDYAAARITGELQVDARRCAAAKFLRHPQVGSCPSAVGRHISTSASSTANAKAIAWRCGLMVIAASANATHTTISLTG